MIFLCTKYILGCLTNEASYFSVTLERIAYFLSPFFWIKVVSHVTVYTHGSARRLYMFATTKIVVANNLSLGI